MKLSQREIERRREIEARTVLVRAAKAAKDAQWGIRDLTPDELDLLFGGPPERSVPCRLCEKPARAQGYCITHLGRLRRNGDPTVCRQAPPPPPCRICGKPGKAMGLCNPHYQAQYRAQRAERRGVPS